MLSLAAQVLSDWGEYKRESEQGLGFSSTNSITNAGCGSRGDRVSDPVSGAADRAGRMIAVDKCLSELPSIVLDVVRLHYVERMPLRFIASNSDGELTYSKVRHYVLLAQGWTAAFVFFGFRPN